MTHPTSTRAIGSKHEALFVQAFTLGVSMQHYAQAINGFDPKSDNKPLLMVGKLVKEMADCLRAYIIANISFEGDPTPKMRPEEKTKHEFIPQTAHLAEQTEVDDAAYLHTLKSISTIAQSIFNSASNLYLFLREKQKLISKKEITDSFAKLQGEMKKLEDILEMDKIRKDLGLEELVAQSSGGKPVSKV